VLGLVTSLPASAGCGWRLPVMGAVMLASGALVLAAAPMRQRGSLLASVMVSVATGATFLAARWAVNPETVQRIAAVAAAAAAAGSALTLLGTVVERKLQQRKWKAARAAAALNVPMLTVSTTGNGGDSSSANGILATPLSNPLDSTHRQKAPLS
jgi:peptidoglycan/LPS O-acetylase OafA/YrhL